MKLSPILVEIPILVGILVGFYLCVRYNSAQGKVERVPVPSVKTEDSEPEILKFPPYRRLHAKITAYCPGSCCCAGFSDGLTAIGRDAYSTRGVAVDNKLIKLRSLVSIPGIGMLEADDTGGAMRQSGKKGIYHIDLRFPTHQEALEWGVQYKDIKVYDNSKTRMVR
jgi:3D (Asp-Asp-Asp) domain-containing protein